MAFEGLVAELKRLIRDRVPGSQAKESVESFGRAKFLLELRFFSSSRTFGSKVGMEYEGGQTIICGLKGHDLKIAVMMLSSSNDWVKECTKEDDFELWGRLVSYDTLYDRAIFGQALEGDSQEESFSDPEPIYEEPEAVLTKETNPVQPQEVIRRAVHRTRRVKLPNKAKPRRASERKLYKKSSDVAAPGRDKRLFWGKPRKLKVIKRSVSKSKRVGHSVPSRKPLKRTLKSTPKINHCRSGPRRPPPVPKFQVSRGTVGSASDPAHIVRILQKKKERGIMALTTQEKQALQRAGLGEVISEEVKSTLGCLTTSSVILMFISIPCCLSSTASDFGVMCFWLGILLFIPRIITILNA
jgi:hypothetical protein